MDSTDKLIKEELIEESNTQAEIPSADKFLKGAIDWTREAAFAFIRENNFTMATKLLGILKDFTVLTGTAVEVVKQKNVVVFGCMTLDGNDPESWLPNTAKIYVTNPSEPMMIQAIKEVRATSNLGLKEAKELVECYAVRMGIKEYSLYQNNSLYPLLVNPFISKA